MKISLCSIGFRKSGYPLAEVIAKVSALGFDGIELWGQHLDRQDLDEVASCLDEHGLHVSMISPYFDLTGSARARAQAISDTDRLVGCAAALDAPLLRVFTGVVGSRDATKEQFDACVSALKEMCDKSAEHGIGLALETHPKTLVDSARECITLLEAVDRPNLKLNLDIYHLWEVHFDPVAVLEWLYDHVAHVHAKNANIPPHSHYPLLHDQQGSQDIIGVTPLKDGNMPYRGFLESLKSKGFDRYVSVEWFGPDIEETAASELAYLQEVFA